jgi:outer membrane protein
MKYKSQLFGKRMLSFMLALFFCFSLGAQDEVWSLQKCVQTALENNLSIKSSAISLKSNEVDIKSAKYARYPTLGVGSDIYWNFGRTIDPTSNTFTTETFLRNGLNLNTGAVLFNGFVIKNRILQSNVQNEALKEDLLQLQNDIALNIATLYLNTLFAKENLAIANANLTLSQNALTQAQIFVKAGSKAPNETLDLEAQLANDEQNLLVASNNLINAKMQLKQLMIVNEDFDVMVPENITLSNESDLLSLDEVYKIALKTQHGISAEELKVRGSEIAIDIAKGQRYPRVTVGGSLGSNYSNQGLKFVGLEEKTSIQKILVPAISPNPIDITTFQKSPIAEKSNYFYQFDNNLSYGVGFSVNMPILNNYETSAGIEKAKLNNAASLLSLETKKQTLKVNVQQSLTDAKAAKAKLVASEKSLKANQAAFDNANKRFQLGGITSLDLTNARTRLDNAKNNLIIAKYDHIFKVKILDFYLGKGISL